MERDQRAAAVILTYLLERTVSEDEAASLRFHTQHSFQGQNGREIPDIVIEGNELLHIVEVKVDPALGLTPPQESGYLGCFASDGEGHLSFLVPSNWKHRAPCGYPVRYWHELIAELEGYPGRLADNVLNEAITFWKEALLPARMETHEREYLNAWSPEKYSAIGKLEKTLLQARRLFELRGFDAEGYYTQEVESSFGFFLKRDNKYLLWVGIWAVAFDIKSGSWFRPANLNALLSGSQFVQNHQLWTLGSETWDSPELIFDRVKAFLDSCQWN
jgi:hypothetical protein